ncbi:DUF4286 family protein [Desertibaculum subflavum]|uniref:DUF4286 family protein n=1 Tax=Desertibaculum subflavum TaxID=2268458 RepID=UPI000E673493
MGLRGSGMLITFMDIAPADEAEFNKWYDGEHVEERVRIPGFLAARRYVAPALSPKYLALYETKDLDVLGGADYQRTLANQTAWSKSVMGRFVRPGRLIAGRVASAGQGRGGWLLFARLLPAEGQGAALGKWLRERWLPEVDAETAVISAHIMKTDPVLSLPLDADGKPDRSRPAAPTRFVLLVEAVGPDALGRALDAADAKLHGAAEVESGAYQLMWELAASDLR